MMPSGIIWVVEMVEIKGEVVNKQSESCLLANKKRKEKKNIP